MGEREEALKLARAYTDAPWEGDVAILGHALLALEAEREALREALSVLLRHWGSNDGVGRKAAVEQARAALASTQDAG